MKYRKSKLLYFYLFILFLLKKCVLEIDSFILLRQVNKVVRIKNKEMEILAELRRTPLVSMNVMASQLKLAPNTVKTRIEKMKSKGIILDDKIIIDPVLGERRSSEILGQVSPEKIGLVPIYYILKGIHSNDDYQEICEYLDNHPYIISRILSISSGLNIYVTFYVPPKGIENLTIFINRLKEMRLTSDTTKLIPDNRIINHINFEYWDIDKMSWSINGESFITEFANIFDETMASNSEIELTNPEFIVRPKINAMDLEIMRELTINGKPRINEIASYYAKDRTTISRRINKVRERYMSHYTLAYNRSIFHLNCNFIIYGKMDRKVMNTIIRIIKENKFPFRSEFLVNKKDFLWRLEATTPFVNALTRLILPYTKNLSQILLHVEEENVYFKYHENFDVKRKIWNVSEENMLNKPLRI